MVAFHFPPQAGSSGVLRALKFCRYLPEAGWLPIVLTAHPRAYERVDDSQLGEVPPDVPVYRAFALNTRKHLVIRQRYFRWMALPDRWVSWCLGAIPTGVFVIFKKRVDVILTTYPIATAVLVGYILHQLTGKPWVADFRDSMTEDEYPREAPVRRVYRWIERKAVRHASLLLFTAASTVRMYLKRYPELRPGQCLVVPNGYDEVDFSHLDSLKPETHQAGKRLRLLHTGLLYPEDRDPTAFFRALARLKQGGKVNQATVSIDLRAPGSQAYYAGMLRGMDIEDLVRLLPPIPYREALREGAEADGLLLFQGASCNHQIPAKAYEYLRLGKPILALTDHAGDTATLLRETGGATTVDLGDEQAIYAALPAFLSSLWRGDHPLPNPQVVQRYSRRSQAFQVAQLLSRLCASTAAE